MSMEKEPGWTRGSPCALLVGLGIVCLVVVLLCVNYVDNLDAAMRQETERDLSEAAQHVAARVEDQVEAAFTGLEAAADAYTGFDDAVAAGHYLEGLASHYGFTHLGVATRDGIVHAGDGRTTRLTAAGAAARARAGEPQICLVPAPADGTLYTCYFVPVYRDGAVDELLVATSPGIRLKEFLDAEIFGGEGFVFIMNQAGELVAVSDRVGLAEDVTNFYTVLKQQGAVDYGELVDEIHGEVSAGRRGLCYYALEDGQQKALCYQPMSMPGWVLMSVVPASYTTERSHPLIVRAVGLALIIVGLFLALTVFVWWTYRRGHRELERIAYVDGVTGGPSRSKFELEAKRAIRAAPGGTYALVYMDVHKFKLINDNAGSAEGDRALRHIYNIIKICLREGELVSRIGSDHFNLLLRNGPPEEVCARLERMAEKINSYNQEREKKFFIRFHAGAYVIDEPELDFVTIQDRANVARRKDCRRVRDYRSLSSCTYYTEVERRRLIREKEISDRVDAAMAAGEFTVYLQPKLDLKTSRVAGAEALVRWQDPERGLIPPGEFIPVMERDGSVIRLDLYVFEQVCALLRRWLDEGRAPVPVAVNLSPLHLEYRDFLSGYRRIIEQYRIPPSLIELELTETMMLEDRELGQRAIEEIHALGVRCAMDDFGSGYSSLNAIKDIRADVLKLDRAFFEGGSGDQRGAWVVESVIRLARKLGMQTVAEGVEQPEQMEHLGEVGCDLVQGFVFSPPVPVEEFEELAFGAEQ